MRDTFFPQTFHINISKISVLFIYSFEKQNKIWCRFFLSSAKNYFCPLYGFCTEFSYNVVSCLFLPPDKCKTELPELSVSLLYHRCLQGKQISHEEISKLSHYLYELFLNIGDRFVK